MLIPYDSEVKLERLPLVNAGIIAVTVVVSSWGMSDPQKGLELAGFRERRDARLSPRAHELLRSLGTRPVYEHTMPTAAAAVSSTLIHAGPWHLLGNMVFLWVFGNPLNARLGHLWYGLLYLVCALTSGLAFSAGHDVPAVGASGAINGIVGAYLVFFPREEISVLWLSDWDSTTQWPWLRVAKVAGLWVVLLWLVVDVAMLWLGDVGIAYIAHVVGFATGLGIAVILAATRWVAPRSGEMNLLQFFCLQKQTSPD
jgi:membrane associated rhomboid family serine protease